MSLICADFSHKNFMVLISRHVNKKSVSILINCQYAVTASISISSHVCFLSSYFPYWLLKCTCSCCKRVSYKCVYSFCKTLCCCLKAHFLDPLYQARVWPRASPSTGHRLHHARSCSACTGKWAPYALALLPLSTVHRHPADRMQNRLCFLSKPCLLFLSLCIHSSLSCPASFLNPRLTLL